MAGDTSRKSRRLAIGYVHNLSKRTAVYTTYALVKNKRRRRHRSERRRLARANEDSHGLDIGIRHSF